MGTENHQHIIQDQIPLETFWPNFSVFETHQMPSSSSCQIGHGSYSNNSTTTTCTPTKNNIVGHQQVLTEERQEDEDEDVDGDGDGEGEGEEELSAMKEMMFKIAAMQPVDIDPATIRKPKRRNVRISNDPQSIAARHRRERISEKIRILQRLVPGGIKMDTASMLDEAISYVKFLKRQIRQLQSTRQNQPSIPSSNSPQSSTWALAKGLSSTTISTRTTTTTPTTTTLAAAAAAAAAATTTYGVNVGANTRLSNNNPRCFDN